MEVPVTKLDAAWEAWRALGQTDRAHFLTLMREAYREMRVSRNGGALPIFVLSEADLDAAEDDRRVRDDCRW
jgi:hypothetical protein